MEWSVQEDGQSHHEGTWLLLGTKNTPEYLTRFGSQYRLPSQVFAVSPCKPGLECRPRMDNKVFRGFLGELYFHLDYSASNRWIMTGSVTAQPSRQPLLVACFCLYFDFMFTQSLLFLKRFLVSGTLTTADVKSTKHLLCNLGHKIRWRLEMDIVLDSQGDGSGGGI